MPGRDSAREREPDTVGRPYMPNYGVVPANEGAGLLPWSYVTERMEKSRNYWIAATRPDGRPHVTPVWGMWVEGAFYFGADAQSRKARNLAANPNLAVHLESGDEAVILEGVAELLTGIEPELFGKLDAVFLAKYQVNLPPEAALYALRPRAAYGWLEKDFPNTATRWRWRS